MFIIKQTDKPMHSRRNDNFIFSPTVNASSPIAAREIVLLLDGGILLEIILVTMFVYRRQEKNHMYGELACTSSIN